jgi:hypothetical protein
MDRDTSSGAGGGEQYDDGREVMGTAAKVREQAADKAREAGHQVEEAAVSKAEEGRHRVAEEVHRVGEALRTGARQMRQGEDDRTTDFIERLAEPVERISRYLERHDTRQLASDLEDFARRNQAAFLGGAFVLGMMGARFLKASSLPQDRQGRADREYGYDDDRQPGPGLTRPPSGLAGDSLYAAEVQRSPRSLEEELDPPR